MDKAFEKSARTFAQAATQGQWQSAEIAARELIALQPGNASLHYNLGLVQRRLGQEKAAAGALLEALRLDADHHNARFELGCALRELGDIEAAGNCFQTYLSSCPQDTDARLNAARIDLRLSALDNAAAHLDHLSENSADAHLLRAELARERSDIAAMRHHLAEAVRLEPSQKPTALKVASQGAAGRLPLDSARLYPAT